MVAVLLMLERMHRIDVLNVWATNTIKKYGPYLCWMQHFGHRFGVDPLKVAPLIRPPDSAAIPLVWAELLSSLGTSVGTVSIIQSAITLFKVSGRLPHGIIACNCPMPSLVESCGINFAVEW
jgi:hypothetical protein